ncbi:MAG: AMP-binding protein [Pseudomonadota bacterium]|nr:AMP-binding protein [Pseudomonadota bacterium]
MGRKTIRAVIDALAESQPDAPFLIAPEPNVTVTYRDLRAMCRSIGGELVCAGIAPGSVVSFLLPNGVSAVTLFLGAMYAGYVVAPISLLAQDSQLDHVLAHSGTRIVFVAPELAERVRNAIDRSHGRALVRPTQADGTGFTGHAEHACPASPSRDAPALLMYTSGTTGVPKGVLLSHWNLVYAARAVVAAHDLTPADRVLSSLPLYHINGQCIATLTPLVSGGSVVAPHRFSTGQWWSWVERYRPTWLNVVPTIMAYLLNGPGLTSGQQEASRAVRFARSASSPLPPEQHRAFEARFGISVIEAMGLTECGSVAFANPLEPGARKLGSPGMPIGVEARVVAADRNALPVRAPGEIQLRGQNVMVGYYKAPELTEAVLSRDGWLSTGDLGYVDEDGFYFITGRLKELIIKGGENIAPREIDEVLLAHPAVLEAAAVGIPDVAYGQEIMACVVLKPEAACTLQELEAHCLEHLGRFKTPKELRVVQELPKGASGKVQRLKLLG